MSHFRSPIAVAFALLTLTACSKYTGPYHICTKSHTATGIHPQMIGKIATMVPYTYTVCDAETKEQYIKVDKTVYRVEEAWKEN